MAGEELQEVAMTVRQPRASAAFSSSHSGRAMAWPCSPPTDQPHLPRHASPPRTNQRRPRAPRRRTEDAGSASQASPMSRHSRKVSTPQIGPPSDRDPFSAHRRRKLLLPGRSRLEAPPRIPSAVEAPPTGFNRRH